MLLFLVLSYLYDRWKAGNSCFVEDLKVMSDIHVTIQPPTEPLHVHNFFYISDKFLFFLTAIMIKSIQD